ncbi:OmpA family protein [Sabulicella glaciei]|uniref:OmpA family protein n=1 Tax=Sabulicella glaciei TaxID=2984948 RepID=A0ABT3NZ72_9PROT|nr:OmpA family protein [Roseococcus sp. MDT2-1-1]MCW8087472.1 OmpA family protein [Roseococcus sp. MDT2-1-1]
MRLALALLAVTGLAACAPRGEAPVAASPAAAPVAAAPAAPAPSSATPAPARPSALPVFFQPWSADMDDQAEEALRELAARAKAHPSGRLLIVGYASPRGTGEANVLLSRLRARVVYDYLVEQGLPASRLRRASRGPTPGMEDLESRRVEVRLDGARN